MVKRIPSPFVYSRDVGTGLPDRPSASSADGPQAPPPRLLNRLRGEIRARHCSLRTESAYVDWVRRFILFHRKRHPQEIGATEVGACLPHLRHALKLSTRRLPRQAYQRQH